MIALHSQGPRAASVMRGACSRKHAMRIQCAGGSPSPRRGNRRDRDRHNAFEVAVVTPPPRSLGVYALPPNTHNGEEIYVEGRGYVVTSLVLTYKLIKGKHVRQHNRLEVQETGRYFLNMMLEGLVNAEFIGPADAQGAQD